ncbi:MAG: hypothetical protein WKG00_02360 [Polyangiaceae bacterium]
MGTFAHACAVSSLPIIGGEDVRVVCLRSTGVTPEIGLAHATDVWVPCALAFPAVYDGYGVIEGWTMDDRMKVVLHALTAAGMGNVPLDEVWGRLLREGAPVATVSGTQVAFGARLVRADVWSALAEGKLAEQTNAEAAEFWKEGGRWPERHGHRFAPIGWQGLDLLTGGVAAALRALDLWEDEDDAAGFIEEMGELATMNKFVESALRPWTRSMLLLGSDFPDFAVMRELARVSNEVLDAMVAADEAAAVEAAAEDGDGEGEESSDDE